VKPLESRDATTSNNPRFQAGFASIHLPHHDETGVVIAVGHEHLAFAQ
jgi:hypothetical protein